ncbi:MAG: glutathione S-transferase family protein [Novosphingobium sp.]|nr:glutathione S-transferase family protein [Novosphingobium sp.]
MMLKLYGHPFSSYTWKALIPIYANEAPFGFEELPVDGQGPAWDFVREASPLGKFPVLSDAGHIVFEATAIIEHLAVHRLPDAGLIPADPQKAVETRKMDRVFDNYVMNLMQEGVNEAIRSAGNPDPAIMAGVRERLERVYAWLDEWLASYERPEQVTLIECAAAPSLFYADWVHQITDTWPRLRDWRAHLLALPAVSHCVEDARPFRPNFPLGAPDRD